MSDLPECPTCGSEYTYDDGTMYVCPECAHEWSKDAVAESGDDARVNTATAGNEGQERDMRKIT